MAFILKCDYIEYSIPVYNTLTMTMNINLRIIKPQYSQPAVHILFYLMQKLSRLFDILENENMKKKKHHRKILQKEYFIILNSHLLLWRHQTFILTAPVLTSLPCSVSSSLYRLLFKDSSRKSPLHSVALKLNHCPLSLKRIKKTPAGIHNHVS